jgi:hypothetical protein
VLDEGGDEAPPSRGHATGLEPASTPDGLIVRRSRP